MFLILDRLDFADLLHVAQTNVKFSILAVDVYRLKYSRFRIVVKDDFSIPDKPKDVLNRIGRVFQRFGIISKTKEKKYHVNVSDTIIRLDDYDSIVDTFKYFGCMIKMLKLASSSKRQFSKAEFMGNLISNYTSDSLVDIYFQHCNENLLEYIAKPLINVENVTFEDCYTSFNRRNMSFIELFPVVRRLNLYFLNGCHFDHLNYRLPHLKHVSIDGISHLHLSGGHSPFIDVIMNNPQIRSISLYDANAEFVQKVNVLLPQLETLTLSLIKQSDESIRFENVTTFTMASTCSPQNLQFPRLRNLHIYFNSKNMRKYITFLNEHKHLSRLYIKQWNLNDLQFQWITNNLTDLVELTLEQKYQSEQLSTNVIVEFLRSHSQVMQLNVINSADRWNVELQHQLKQEWDTKMIERSLSFERRANN